jgi:hypothetical protein
MIITTGRVRSGKIEIDDDSLPEGTKVTVLASEGRETFDLDPEDEAALLAAIAEVERGDSVSAAEVRQKIHRR